MYFLVVLLAVLIMDPSLVNGVVPSVLAAKAKLTRLQIIKNYFACGMSYPDMLVLLFVIHGIKLSLRQLNRILKGNNLFRRKNKTPDDVIRNYIHAEIEGSGHCVGYRSMWQRLVRDHQLIVSRDSVLRIMREFDPEGVNLRKAHRLSRRKYIASGPNYVWHVDGYDKLKPYGFCIHGAIDGYSRRILWLEVSSTNNDSAVIASYYLDTLNALGVAPRLLRCDRGTENTRLALLQPFFRYSNTDSLSGLKSFMYGKSTSNQRIESFWGMLRRQGVHWWISLFKDMQDANLFDGTNIMHMECMKYCFMDLIQAELDRIASNWNMHAIRPQKNSHTPCGKPDLLYFVPEIFGGRDYGHKIDRNDLKTCMELYGKPKLTCSEEFKDLIHLVLSQHDTPSSVEEALAMYENILGSLEDMF